jgi:hypothetical protein
MVRDERSLIDGGISARLADYHRGIKIPERKDSPETMELHLQEDLSQDP